MSIKPENVKASAGPEVFLPSDIVSEDVAIVILTPAALAIVGYIEGAGSAVKKHVLCVLFESWLGVVLADDKFRMRVYVSYFSAPGITAKALGRCPNRLGVNIIY